MRTRCIATVIVAALGCAAQAAESGDVYEITLKLDSCAAMAASLMVTEQAPAAKEGSKAAFSGVLTKDAACDGRAILPRGSKIVGTTVMHQETAAADGTDAGDLAAIWFDVTFNAAVLPDGSSIPVVGALRRTANLR